MTAGATNVVVSDWFSIYWQCGEAEVGRNREQREIKMISPVTTLDERYSDPSAVAIT